MSEHHHASEAVYHPIPQGPVASDVAPTSSLDDLDDDVYDYFDVGPSGSSLPLGSAIRNGGEFALRYDTETPLRRIDVGGDDQDLRCVPAAYLSMPLL